MKTRIAIACFLVLGIAAAGAQTSPAPSAVPAEPVVPMAAPAGTPAGLAGTWEARLCIHEMFGTLKETRGGLFLVSVTFKADGTGSLDRGGNAGPEPFEWEMKDNQLTVAWGSRLNPRLDLYRVLFLADGSLYMRSTRLSNATGSVTYLLGRSIR